MQNKKWKKFEKLTEKCYMNMIGSEKDGSCWKQAFELMKEIILEEREDNPAFARELELIDDSTDYSFDIQGWLEDCLDEIDMRGDYETLLCMYNDLIELFDWPEYTGSDIKFGKTAALRQLGREKESLEFCRKWMEKEPENIVAAAAGVYTFVNIKEFEEAEKLVDRFIINKSVCGEDDEIMFTAASKLYKAMGRKKEQKEIDKAVEKYEKYLEQYFMDSDFDEFDDINDFDELPFD